MLIEMAEEISLFQKVRRAITSASNKKTLIIAIDLFIEYQKKYGDRELFERIDRLRSHDVNIDDAAFVFEKVKAKMIAIYNWYNDKRRRSPQDINEDMIK